MMRDNAFIEPKSCEHGEYPRGLCAVCTGPGYISVNDITPPGFWFSTDCGSMNHQWILVPTGEPTFRCPHKEPTDTFCLICKQTSCQHEDVAVRLE